MKKSTKIIIGLVALGTIIGLFTPDDKEEKQESKPVATETVKKEEKPKKDKKKEEKPKEEVKEEPKEVITEINDELVFSEFKINMKSVKFYEEDGKDLAEVKYTWTNQSGDGKKYFFALTTHNALQGDEVLTETTGAADIENKKTNSYHEHNGEGGTVNIRLVYELVDKETPLTLRFKPLNEFDEDKQEITIEIN